MADDFTRTRMRRFRVDVGTIICAVALVQSLLLVALGYWAVERMVSKVGTAAHKINHDRVEDNVLAFLAKTHAVVRAIGDSPSLHAAGEDGAQTAEMLWTLLEQTPELDSLDVATDDGHLVSAMRYPAPALRQVLRSPGFSTETWQYKRSPDAEGGDAKQRFATTNIAAYRSDYDPAQRTFAHMLAAGTAGGVQDMAFAVAYRDRRYLVQTSHIPSTQWQLVSWEPEDLLLGDLQRTVLWALLLIFAFLGVAMFISLRLSKLVTRPIENLSRVARRIGRLELDDLPLEASRVLEIQHLNQALDESARSLRAFSKFVPVDIIKQLVAEGQALAPSGAPRRITAMFTDVEGFTSISESLDADVLVKQLTEYFNLAARIFARHGGVVDKYMGDGIMVLWGAPADLEDAAYRACLAALELHAEMSELNGKWHAEGLREFRTRIGIHTGLVIAGVLGSSDRLSYTAVGDVINVASRIEGANKDLGTRTLISEATFAALGGRIAARRIEEMIELRGRHTRMVLYELLEIEHQPR